MSFLFSSVLEDPLILMTKAKAGAKKDAWDFFFVETQECDSVRGPVAGFFQDIMVPKMSRALSKGAASYTPAKPICFCSSMIRGIEHSLCKCKYV